MPQTKTDHLLTTFDKQHNNFLSIVFDIKKKYRKRIYDRTTGWLSYEDINYLASVNNHHTLSELRALLSSKNDLVIFDINLFCFKAIYIEFNDGYKMFFLSVHEAYKTLDSAILNHGLSSKISDELQEEIKKQKITGLDQFNFDFIFRVINAFNLVVMNHHNLSLNDFVLIQFKNTQTEFTKYIRYYQKYQKLFTLIADSDYTHLFNFSRLYYFILNMIANEYKERPKPGGYVIHDAGTSDFQLSFLLALLPERDLGFNIQKIVATDIDMWHNDVAARFLSEQIQCKPVDLIQLDFLDEAQILPIADFTILIDVLEHFKTKDLALRALERLWERTKNMLIIHVPFEERPNPAWNHYLSFNKERLREFGMQLKNCVLLNSDYGMSKDISFEDQGFLIIKRVY